MNSAALIEVKTEQRHGFCHLWWARLELPPEMDNSATAIRARRDMRLAWVRAKLASVTNDVEGALAAVGRAPTPGRTAGCAGWSSCGDIVFLAFGKRPLAVDIEAKRSVPPGMARRYGINPDRFWPGWTQKEAALKLLGSGLRIDPARLMLLGGGGAALDGKNLPIHVEEIAAPPGYVAALAYVESGGVGDAGCR
ncbi:hypothetical protein BH10PSE12_BH10PSE12_15620 [soil metagenome]